MAAGYACAALGDAGDRVFGSRSRRYLAPGGGAARWSRRTDREERSRDHNDGPIDPTVTRVIDMTTKHEHDNPILVTGAAGAVGGIGRSLTEFLVARGRKVRALVRREDARAEALRRLGAEVVKGDLTDLASMHRAIDGCRRIYFGMSVSPAYLEATINTAAVARHHGVDVFVNMSQMTVTQMSISETTDSPQHKLHWLAEQALSWSGLPVVTVRPTVFLEGFFLQLAAPACGPPTSWGCRWAAARPRRSRRSMWRVRWRRSSTSPRRISDKSTI